MQNYNSKFKILTFYIVILIFAFSILILTSPDAYAATNISVTTAEHYAWNDVIGWVDFYQTGNVNVYANRLEGYATSSVGYIALNCNSTPNGDVCSTSNFSVQNDSNGNLTGWGWNDSIGWVSFDSATATSSYTYQVTVNGTTGDFTGWAWNDVAGWISFNCSNTTTCGTSDYKVKTSWAAASLSGNLSSSIFDTGVASGTAINTVMWQGSKPSGTNVKFQVASDSTSTPASWNYFGPDGSNTTYYTPTDAGIPVQINLAHHNNKRYFRYKVFLESNAAQTLSPRVDDVIINYSP